MVRWVFRICVAFFAVAICIFDVSEHSQHQAGLPADAPYTLVLVDSDSKADLARARDFIMSQGGRVAIVLPPHAIMGWIPLETDARILGRYGIRSIHRSPLASPPPKFR